MRTLLFLLVSAGTVASAAEAQAQEAPQPAPSSPPPDPSPVAPNAVASPDQGAPFPAPPDGGTRISAAPSPVTGLASRATPTASGGPGNPASVAAGPGGFRIVSEDQRSEIRFRALVQADGRFWFDDTQRPQVNTFLVRRAQPWMEGKLPYGVNFMLSPDFGGGTVVLQDAYVGWDLHDAFRLRFGKFRSPFGLERLQPTSNLSFVEFGLPTLLSPNRDVGAMASGDLFKRFIGYNAGIFNGVPDNGSDDLDSDSSKEFAGRIYLRPFAPIPDAGLGRLFVGVSSTFGRAYGTPATPFGSPAASPAYKTPGQNTDFSYTTAPSGVTPNYANTVVANGPHNRYGAYLYEALGPLGVMGEYYMSNQEVGLAGKPNTFIDNKAYQAQVTFVLFGAQASYDFVHVETPFDPAAGHFGALELAARVGHLSIDPKAFPTYTATTASVRGATEYTAGINWYISDNGKFVLNWDHTEFQGGAKTPAELAAGHREAENIFLMRAQVVY